jgi:hypothetical protein
MTEDSPSELLDEFISSVFAPDLLAMDERCAARSLFKYYMFPKADIKLGFFEKPRIKFAVKSQLNDPFELTKRWKKFGSPITYEIFGKYITKYIDRRLDDSNYVKGELIKTIVKKYPNVTARNARRIIGKNKFDHIVAELRAEIEKFRDKQISDLYQLMEKNSDGIVESAAQKTGIFSLTESSSNPAMWGLYAGSGNGFALEFDPQHKFFTAENAEAKTVNRLRRVFYQDDRIEEFWRNPLYLFQVKNSEFSFEKEWRMLEGVENCNQFTLPDGSILYNKACEIGLIKSITFGYNYSNSDIKSETGIISKFDEDIRFFKARINSTEGVIEKTDL